MKEGKRARIVTILDKCSMEGILRIFENKK